MIKYFSGLAGTQPSLHYPLTNDQNASHALEHVVCQASSHPLSTESSSWSRSRKPKSRQEKLVTAYEALRPKRLSGRQGLPGKTQLALPYKKQKWFHWSNCSLQNITALQLAMGPLGLEVPRAQILPHHGSRTQDIVSGASALCSGVPQVPSWKIVSVLVRLVGRRNFFGVNNHIHYQQCRNNLVLFSWK